MKFRIYGSVYLFHEKNLLIRTCLLVFVGVCDICAVGSVLAGNHCEPCAPHCQTCDDAGPGSCDVCIDGFFIDKKESSNGS